MLEGITQYSRHQFAGYLRKKQDSIVETSDLNNLIQSLRFYSYQWEYLEMCLNATLADTPT